MFKKKKKEEEVKPEDVPEAPEPEEQLPEPQKPSKKEKKLGESTLEVKGEFSVNMEEMALFAQLAVSSEEYKIYQQGLVGQKLDKIVKEYNKAIGEKSEVPSSEDTDKEILPE